MKRRKGSSLLKWENLSRREFLRLSALLGAGAALSACGPTPAPTPVPPEPTATPVPPVPTATPVPPVPTATPVPPTPTPIGPTGTLTIAQSGAFMAMDPYFDISYPGNSTQQSICEALIDREGTPLLAESWENPDELTWRFHLRKGVKFHNGDDFTAEAVKFSIERFTDPENPARRAAHLAAVEKVEIVDDYTIDFTTKEPISVLDTQMHDTLILSPRAVKELGEDIAKSLAGAGTGPFKFVEWVPGEKCVIEANEDYWGGMPRVKTVIVRPIPEPTVRVTELKTGGVDLAADIPPQFISEIEEAPGVYIERVTSSRVYEVTINCAEPPFDDVRVRQAFNYAIDKEELCEYVLFGIATPAAGMLSAPHEGHNPDLKPYPYDPDKARALLAEAGYPDGIKITINSPSGRYLQDKQLAEAIAGQVSEAGIDMTVNVLEWATFLKSIKVDNNGFLMLMGVWPTHGALVRHLDSRREDYVWYGYHNDEVNALLDKAAATFDPKERKKVWQEIGKIARDEAIWAFLADMQEIWGVSDKVKDFTLRGHGVNPVDHKIYLAP